MRNLIEDFLDKYDKVFDKENQVRLCGRKACRNLIEVSMKIKKYRRKDYFGDLESGCMHIRNIQKLRNEILMAI